MDPLTRRSDLELSIVPFEATASVANDLEIARQRMRHLASWKVGPLLSMQAFAGKPIKTPTAGLRKRIA